MQRLQSILLIICVSFLIGSTVGCKKQQITDNPNARLAFSTDTLWFDTVFTTQGSSTRLMKIFNPNNQRINISRIRLAGGSDSPFQLNIDGLPGDSFTDIEIAPNDSIYVFAEVTIDPGNVNDPFLVLDSIFFETNGNLQQVHLAAYGQDAYFYRLEELCTQTWANDKPHVILGSILIDTGCTLTITEGTRIYVRADANILVAGTLQIEGSKDSFVTFQGDRLEPFFDDLAGQWGQIIFLRGSTGNVVRYTEISEAVSGIVIGSMVSNQLADFNTQNLPDVTLEQVIIRHTRDYGIFSFFSDVSATNTLIHSVGRNNVAAFFGGKHTYTNCTFVNYGVLGIDHKLPVLTMTNFAVQNQTIVELRPADYTFRNSIIYGNIPPDTSQMAGEVAFEKVDGGPFDFLFDHCLLRTNLPASTPEFINVTTNADPLFANILEGDYRPLASSPAVNRADAAFLPAIDLFGEPRNGLPDLGAIIPER